MKTCLTAVLLLSSVSLWAADLVLEDFEGKVEVRSGTGWKMLDIGAPAAEASTVRVTGDGVAEFRSGALRIHISKDGTYQLAALVEKARKAPAPSLFEVVADKTDRLLSGKTTRPGQVNAGVRGAQVSGGELPWAEDDDAAAPVPADSVLAKARSLAQQGRDASALREALAAGVPPTSPWYAAASLLIAQEALAVGDYDLVVRQSAQASPVVEPESAQALRYLEALARTALGQTAEAKQALEAVVAAGADTPIGQKAAGLLPR